MHVRQQINATIFGCVTCAGILIFIAFTSRTGSSLNVIKFLQYDSIDADLDIPVEAPSNETDAVPSLPLEIESSKWAPFSISECLPSLPQHAAPCRPGHRPGVTFAEELFYPDFAIRIPHFPRDIDRERWSILSATIRSRAIELNEWMIYKSQVGQNLVLANRTYHGTPRPDKWSDTAW